MIIIYNKAQNKIMRKQKNKKSQNPEQPEIEIRFIKQKKWQQQNKQQQKLRIELLRVQSAEKQSTIEPILLMQQQQLCQFFITYETLTDTLFQIEELKQSTRLKLIRNNGRVYFGEVVNKQMNGLGICYYKEGKVYEGQFVGNKKQGVGSEIYANGNLYIGEFVNNKKHGKGQFFWFKVQEEKASQGQFFQYYDGEWWGGLPDGKGVMQKSNGDYYEGTFKNGLKHGFGWEKFTNGDFYKGQYINGLPEGIGEYNWKDGASYKGDFKQGLRNGYGLWKIDDKIDGEKYEGHYSMDRKSGYGQYYWQNGWLYKGNFENDFRDGYGELFNRQNLIYRGQWRKGDKNPSQPPNNMIKLSRLQLKNQLVTNQKQVQVEGICQDININKNELKFTKHNEHELLTRPGFTIRKQINYSKFEKKRAASRVLKNDPADWQTTMSSRIGTEIHRPISKAFSIQSARNLKQSQVNA